MSVRAGHRSESRRCIACQYSSVWASDGPCAARRWLGAAYGIWSVTRHWFVRNGWLPHPPARIAPQAHPGAECAALARGPAHLDVAEHALGVRHQRGEAAVGRGHARQAAGAAVRVERVALGDRAVVVDEAQGRNRLRGIAALPEVGVALA